MQIAIVTDACAPQTNGVVTTLTNTVTTARRLGHDVRLITPAGLRSFACPSYPEIRLAINAGAAVRREFDESTPDFIHIATEGPLGLAARSYCIRKGLRFTSSYHTQFPEYVQQRWRIPLRAGYAYMRWFHDRAAHTMVGTQTVRTKLAERGLKRLMIWSRGVDTENFRPTDKSALSLPRPIHLYAGRVAVEKNLDAFLKLDLPGSKVVVGDGPQLAELRARYPGVTFTGFRFGAELAAHIAAADVFVFPSCTDTFGLVMLEAMACGIPVAAFPVTGPLDVVRDGVTGALDTDLRAAIDRALAMGGANCRPFAETHTWERCTRQFIDNLVPVTAEQRAGSAKRRPYDARPSPPGFQ